MCELGLTMCSINCVHLHLSASQLQVANLRPCVYPMNMTHPTLLQYHWVVWEWSPCFSRSSPPPAAKPSPPAGALDCCRVPAAGGDPPPKGTLHRVRSQSKSLFCAGIPGPTKSTQWFQSNSMAQVSPQFGGLFMESFTKYLGVRVWLRHRVTLKPL